MAEKEPKDGEVVISQKQLATMMEAIASAEQKAEEATAKAAGLAQMFADGASTEGEKVLREKKSFEPKFRTVRIRKYPVAGDVENTDYIVGWTKRGAYQEVDRAGVSPQVVDMIEVIFLNNPKKAEKIRLLDLLNRGEQIHCKILKTEKKNNKIETGEEIDITVWDPAHGLVSTGDKIDGFYGKDEITYTIQIPGVEKPVEINGDFVNN